MDWDQRFYELKKFVCFFGRYPSREKTRNDKERDLRIWLNIELRKIQTNELSKKKTNKLRILPVLLKQNSLQKKYWNECYIQLQQFYMSHKTFPQRRRNTSSTETKLNRWMERQRRNFRNGKLDEGKIELLECIPEWTWYTTKEVGTLGELIILMNEGGATIYHLREILKYLGIECTMLDRKDDLIDKIQSFINLEKVIEFNDPT